MPEHPVQANRTLDVFSAVWTWASKQKYVAAGDNPARDVEKYRESARERYLTNDELTRLGEALVAAETIGLPYAVDEASPNAKHASKPDSRYRRIDAYALAAIRVLMLTGARLREVLHAKWEYVDFDRGMIFLPDSKTGKKPIYLSAAAAEFCPGYHAWREIHMCSRARNQGNLKSTSRSRGLQYVRLPASKGFAFMTFATVSLPSVPAPLWGYQSSGSCSAIDRPQQRNDTRILMTTRCGEQSRQSDRQLRRR